MADVENLEARDLKLDKAKLQRQEKFAKQQFLSEKKKEIVNLRETLYSISERTTFQGVPNAVAVETRLPVRLIYIVTILIFTGLTFFFLSLAVQNYLQYEVDTAIEIVRETEFEFPTVTFCNLQICGFKDYDFSAYLKKYKQDEQEKFGASQDAIIDNKLRTDNTKTTLFSAKEVFLRKYEDSELTRILNKEKKSIGKMLISCNFGGLECTEDDFEFVQMGEFTKCYRFNSGYNFNGDEIKRKRTNRFGQTYGFRMELYVGTQEECKSPLSVASGMIIYIHNWTYTLTEEDNGILVKPGSEANIVLDRTTVKKLPDPYSNCFDTIETYPRKKSDLIQRTISYSERYSQQYCLQLCYQDFLIEFCDCYDHTLPKFRPPGKSPCSKFIDSLYNCQYLIEKLFYNGKNDEYCLNECPKECEFIKFDSTISSIQYPSPGYHEIAFDFNKRKQDLFEANPSSNVSSSINEGALYADGSLSVNIFYGSGSYTKIYEKPAVEIKDLIPDLGGRLGLFLGISILTFIEVFEVIYEICYAIVRKCYIVFFVGKEIKSN